MSYHSLEDCLMDLEKHKHLIRIKEEVDPHLEMAAIHLRVFEANGPALLFENVKGCKYRAASNIFGSLERSKFIFRNTFKQVQQLIGLKNDPINAIKHPINNATAALAALKAFPLKNPISKPVLANKAKGTFRFFLDGNPIFNGFNPIVGFSDNEKKFTFYCSRYSIHFSAH